jgi:hypothetical protein
VNSENAAALRQRGGAALDFSYYYDYARSKYQ